MSTDQRSPEAHAHHKWYKLAVWHGIRAQQIASHPLCEFHRQRGEIVPATHCDHIEPHKGDWFKFVNGPFQSLCASCHSSTKQQIERTGGFSGSDRAGNPLDKNHHWNV